VTITHQEILTMHSPSANFLNARIDVLFAAVTAVAQSLPRDCATIAAQAFRRQLSAELADASSPEVDERIAADMATLLTALDAMPKLFTPSNENTV
jgi:hypothetical protein